MEVKSKLKCLLKPSLSYYFLYLNDFNGEEVYKNSVHQCITSFLYFANKTLGFYIILPSLFHCQIEKESISVQAIFYISDFLYIFSCKQHVISIKLNLKVKGQITCNSTNCLCVKCPNTEFFLVLIFLYSDQKKFRFWTLFTQCVWLTGKLVNQSIQVSDH